MVKHWGEFLEIDQRHGEDTLIKTMRIINLLGWIFIFFSLILLEMAKPGRSAFLNQSVQLPQVWDNQYLLYFFFSLILALLCSLTGVIINAKRHHRKTDQYRISLFILGIISSGGILFYVFMT